MAAPLRVLIIEDSEDDALLVARVLSQGGYDPLLHRVEDAFGLEDALQHSWDLIISDYSMPSFSTPQALRLLQRKGVDIPFIMVSGTVGEARAVEVMKAGAHDYIMKGQLSRLVPAVRRELREAEHRRERSRIQSQVQKLSRAIEQAAECIFITDPDGIIEYINPAFERMTGFTSEEAIGKSPQILRSGEHPASFYRGMWRTLREGGVFRDVVINRRKDGALYHEEKVITPVKDSSRTLTHYISTGQDISDRVKDEAIRKRLTATLEATTDFVAISDPCGHLLYANATRRSVLGLGLGDEVGICTIFDGHTEWACAKLKNKAIPVAIREGTWSGELALIGQDGLEIPVSEVIIAHHGPEGEVQFLSAIARDISERKRLEGELAYRASHDALTHIPNRMLLLDRLQQSIAYARRHHHSVGVLFVDLDRFKRINDTLGHHVGDFILHTVAQRIRHCLRRSDTVGRQGGDEFVVIAAEISDRDDLAPNADKIRKAVSGPIKVKNHQIVLTCSIGIAVYPFDGENPDVLLKNADTAMYQAKGSGRDDYRYYAKEMNAQCHEVLKLEEELRRAVKAGEFVLHYQPQVDLQTGAVSRVEALIRWAHPKRGLLAPGTFIPVLEETGLIEPVGEWVLQEAARQAGAWKERGLPSVVVAVNLSARQFASPYFAETIERIVTATGTSLACLELEITESVLMEDAFDGAEALQTLSQHGMRVAVDDFGTGYCALHYMRRLPVDTLKVDYGFVRDLEEDSITASIVSAIITLGHNLGCLVVAEGVETATQRDILCQLGCDFGQGYFYYHPSPPEEIEHLLQRGLMGEITTISS